MPALHCQVSNGVATLTMDRPQARNALDAEMKDLFAQVVPALRDDAAVRAVILTGAGHAFCAGGDLRSMRAAQESMTVEGGRRRMREVHPWLRMLLELDRPLIAAVDGPAFGAGFSLALAADFVLASPRARFCMSFMRVGLVPDFAAMYTLPRVVGVQRAKEIMLSAREIDADEALRLGIAMEVVAAEQLPARAMALARSFVDASPLAVALVKQGTGLALAQDAGRLLEQEAEHQALCFATEAHRAAVERFLEKQPAAFRWPAPDARS